MVQANDGTPVMTDSQLLDLELRYNLTRPEAEKVWHAKFTGPKRGRDKRERQTADQIKSARTIYRQTYEQLPAGPSHGNSADDRDRFSVRNVYGGKGPASPPDAA